jgi:hypothetical protein
VVPAPPYAQTAGPTQLSAQPAALANAAPNSQAAPAEPPIDKSQIAQRLNRELDFNLEIITSGWQHALDRVDGELARPRLRYTELNRLRDELQRIRSDVAEAWGKIQPRMDADRAGLARTRGLAVLSDHAISLALKHGDPARRAIERHYRHVLLKIAIGDCDVIKVCFGVLCGRKSVVSQGPRSAHEETFGAASFNSCL